MDSLDNCPACGDPVVPEAIHHCRPLAMSIVDMIAEWRRGCSDAGRRAVSEDPEVRLHPERCGECTRALIEAIERRARLLGGL